MSKEFFEAVKERRTIYGIGNESPISEEKIESIVNEAVKYTPTAFNSQSGRVVVLFGDAHHTLWNIAKEALRKIIPADSFESTEQKINSFDSGYGTILFFEDMSVIESLQENFSLYKDNFPIWSQQASGILQYVIWTGLYMEGLGVSLQHYSELIEADVKKQWDICDKWKLIAQMPFGKPTAPAGDKEFKPLEDRIKVIH